MRKLVFRESDQALHTTKYEPQREKTNNVDSDQVWHKPGCIPGQKSHCWFSRVAAHKIWSIKSVVVKLGCHATALTYLPFWPVYLKDKDEIYWVLATVYIEFLSNKTEKGVSPKSCVSFLNGTARIPNTSRRNMNMPWNKPFFLDLWDNASLSLSTLANPSYFSWDCPRLVCRSRNEGALAFCFHLSRLQYFNKLDKTSSNLHVNS